jgi:hypothetical protein
MKKILSILIAVLCFAAVANAQPKALGLRATYGAELSYQHYAGGQNFWEFDAGVFDNLLDLVAIYDFSIAPIGPFNFYAGPGAFIAMWPGHNETHMNVGLAGQVGLEYTFDFPLQLSLDWRPCFNFMNGFAWAPYGAALGIRYAF